MTLLLINIFLQKYFRDRITLYIFSLYKKPYIYDDKDY